MRLLKSDSDLNSGSNITLKIEGRTHIVSCSVL